MNDKPAKHSAMLTISFPDSPAMRELLNSLAAHVADDEQPFFEEIAEDSNNKDERRHAAEMERACGEFVKSLDVLFGA